MAPVVTRELEFSSRFISRPIVHRSAIQRALAITIDTSNYLFAGLKQTGRRKYEISRVDGDVRENER